MKKIYFMLAAVVMLLSGCDIHTTEIVKPGVDMFTDYIDAYAGDWKRPSKIKVGEPGFYVYQEFGFKEITNKVLREGAVMVYLVDGDNRDNALPYVFPVDNGRNIIMQNIRFEVEKGILTLVIEWQDFDLYDQQDMRFKVCILSPGD
ncbi:MAG: hypothetical protein J5705_04125 [Bacteroidaceae bacterium]|nr:hypothetical protein [Bacteroidaceae bacterium]